jgi:hypothetical protein
MARCRVGLIFLVVGAVCSVVVPAWAQSVEDVANTHDLGFNFTTRDNEFSLRLWGALQIRYTYLDYDQRVLGNDTDYSGFYLRRARVWLAGHAFDPRFTYLLHIQLENSDNVNLHDAWLEYRLSPLVNIGVGRFKIAYGLEFLNSGFTLQFVERSVFSGETDINFGEGPIYPGGGTWFFGLNARAPTGFATGGHTLYRSQGVQLAGMRGSKTTPTVEYQIGVWQGRGTQGSSNPDNRHLFAVRVGYHPWGWIDWRFQGDTEGSERYRFGVLGSAYSQSTTEADGYDERGYDLAIVNRFRGFSLDAEWATEIYDLHHSADEVERKGWRVQAGYMLIPAKLEVAARYAENQRLRPATYRASMGSGLLVANVFDGEEYVPQIEGKISEITVGVNWFINEGHRHKLQVDTSWLTREFADDPGAIIDGESSPITALADQKDWRFRAMIQLVF